MRSTQQLEPQSERSRRPAVQTAAATEEAVASAGVASAEERDVSAAYPAPTLSSKRLLDCGRDRREGRPSAGAPRRQRRR